MPQVGAGQTDHVGFAEEVRCVQHVDVQRLALDPLSAVQQTAQGGRLSVYDDAARVLDGTAGTHLVGDGTDPADAGGEVGWLRVRSAPEEGFEEPRRLVDLEPRLDDGAVVDPQVQRGLALDTGQ